MNGSVRYMSLALLMSLFTNFKPYQVQQLILVILEATLKNRTFFENITFKIKEVNRNLNKQRRTRRKILDATALFV